MASSAETAVESQAQQIARKFKIKPDQIETMKRDIWFFALANWDKIENQFLTQVRYCQAEDVPVHEYFLSKMQQRRRK